MAGAYDIKAVQRAVLDVFKAVDGVCARHGLHYFAIGGTCIGAVRHAGFIPWDDDIDIAMPREDYDQFLQIANGELPEKYRRIGYDYSLHYNVVFSKVHDVETTVIEGGMLRQFPDRYTGVWVDVFPLDGMPSNRWKWWRWKRAIRHCQNMNVKRRFRDFQSLTGMKRLRWKLMRHSVMEKPFTYYAEKYEDILRAVPYDSSEFTSLAIFPRGYKWKWPVSDFADYIDMPFEDFHMRVPVGYDDMLRTQFGDYMTLPPVEERGQHCTFVDLERPYTYYQEHVPKLDAFFAEESGV